MNPGSIMVENQKFIEMLTKIDECIDYFRKNPDYTESGTYLGRFKQLQTKAISAIKIKIYNVFRYAAVQVEQILNFKILLNQDGSLLIPQSDYFIFYPIIKPAHLKSYIWQRTWHFKKSIIGKSRTFSSIDNMPFFRYNLK